MRPARSTLISGATIFLSAFLLFWIQPLIAKRILPWFGGATAVWVTCLLFFQAVLLAGYCYAHALSRAPARVQGMVHAVALAAGIVLLHFGLMAARQPPETRDPILDILLLLGSLIGLPYFLLSATTPLVSSWYVRLEGAGMPYRLYALSNFASLVALIAFPTVLEPHIGVGSQLQLWSIAFSLFAALCAWLSLAALRHGAAASASGAALPDDAPPPRARDWALWLSLAACGSAMLLAVTNHLIQNVAAIPFLWVLPLTLYLLTFIIAFERERWYRPLIGLVLAAIALNAMSWGLTAISNRGAIRQGVPLYAAGLFCCCLFCHGELSWRKPPKQYLTGFYLAVSLGGALGAGFVSVLAPHVFNSFYEFPLTMLACAALALVVNWKTGRLRVAVALAAFGVVAWYGVDRALTLHYSSRVMVRNFYGGLRVDDIDLDDGSLARELVNGTINHGVQYQDPIRRRRPISYYGQLTGIGWALRTKKFQHPEGIRVGVIGLGTGTIAAYGGPGDQYRFYEINPLVEGVARGWFTYLADSGARISVIQGDGRISLSHEPPARFDVLAVDAFSSDSIPVHLLTREAALVYRRELDYDGILALHISNANLDLRPVAAAVATAMGARAWLFETDPDPNRELFATSWVLIGGEQEAGKWRGAGATLLTPRPGFRPWTDDYSNLFEVLK
jgi:hypothetical protein